MSDVIICRLFQYVTKPISMNNYVDVFILNNSNKLYWMGSDLCVIFKEIVRPQWLWVNYRRRLLSYLSLTTTFYYNDKTYLKSISSSNDEVTYNSVQHSIPFLYLLNSHWLKGLCSQN